MFFDPQYWNSFLNESLQEQRSNVQNINVQLLKEQTVYRDSETYKHNLRFLIDADFLRNFQVELSQKEFYKLFFDIKPLQEHKIIRKLGEGYYGIVFLMDSGNVLKIFVGSVRKQGNNSIDAELQMYSKIQHALHSGRGTRNTVMIYDFGKSVINRGILGMRGAQFGWVEMSKVIPYRDYLAMTGRDRYVAEGIGPNSLGYFFVQFRRNYRMNQQWSIKEFMKMHLEQHYKDWHKIFSFLTKREIIAILFAYYEFIRLHPEELSPDIHFGNIGINVFDTNSVVIFDY